MIINKDVLREASLKAGVAYEEWRKIEEEIDKLRVSESSQMSAGEIIADIVISNKMNEVASCFSYIEELVAQRSELTKELKESRATGIRLEKELERMTNGVDMLDSDLAAKDVSLKMITAERDRYIKELDAIEHLLSGWLANKKTKKEKLLKVIFDLREILFIKKKA